MSQAQVKRQMTWTEFWKSSEAAHQWDYPETQRDNVGRFMGEIRPNREVRRSRARQFWSMWRHEMNVDTADIQPEETIPEFVYRSTQLAEGAGRKMVKGDTTS